MKGVWNEHPKAPQVDNITHAALGLCAGVACAGQDKHRRLAALAALLAAEAPDLDVIVRLWGDSLDFVRWHRHFTHSLTWAPLWAWISARWVAARYGRSASCRTRDLLGPALAGVLSHLVCDACTSYGTTLGWPWTQTRYAWDCLPIVDLLVTLPMLLLSIGAWRRAAPWESSTDLAVADPLLSRASLPAPAMACLGLLWFSLCALGGVWMRQQAESTLKQELARRQVVPERVVVKPTVLNLVLWRGLWLAEGSWHAAAIRVVPWGTRQLVVGESRRAWSPTRENSPPASSAAGQKLALFDHFTDGIETYQPTPGGFELGDARYATLPTELTSLWSVRYQAPNQVRMLQRTPTGSAQLQAFWSLLWGSDPRLLSLGEQNIMTPDRVQQGLTPSPGEVP